MAKFKIFLIALAFFFPLVGEVPKGKGAEKGRDFLHL